MLVCLVGIRSMESVSFGVMCRYLVCLILLRRRVCLDIRNSRL